MSAALRVEASPQGTFFYQVRIRVFSVFPLVKSPLTGAEIGRENSPKNKPPPRRTGTAAGASEGTET
jgi:hypothetical protein